MYTSRNRLVFSRGKKGLLILKHSIFLVFPVIPCRFLECKVWLVLKFCKNEAGLRGFFVIKGEINIVEDKYINFFGVSKLILSSPGVTIGLAI